VVGVGRRAQQPVADDPFRLRERIIVLAVSLPPPYTLWMLDAHGCCDDGTMVLLMLLLPPGTTCC
jgi:hypothetical protein